MDKSGDQQISGFYCEVCDCVVKDSLNYLDHINGKRHHKNLGQSLKIEDATLEEVKERFEAKKCEREDRLRGYDIVERIEDIRVEEKRLRKEKKDKKKRAKARREKGEDSDVEDKDDGDGSDVEEQDEMAIMMGFSNFSTSKR